MSNCQNPVQTFGWCKGPGGRAMCLACKELPVPAVLEPVSGETPAATDAPETSAPPTSSPPPPSAAALARFGAPAAYTPPSPVRISMRSAPAPALPSRIIRSSTGKADIKEIEALCGTKAPASMMGMHAYRGVGSDPTVYRKRGGFKPWQVDSLDKAKVILRSLACEGDLGAIALKWQLGKDKADGYFLSTGTSALDAYDNYKFVYRQPLDSLVLRDWNDMLGEVSAASVEDCYLYTDQVDLAASTIIVILCARGGKSRLKEALIMSPLAVEGMEIEDKGNYISCLAWIERYGK